MNTNLTLIEEKIAEVICGNDTYTAARLLCRIMHELAQRPQSLDAQTTATVDYMIDLVCENHFG